MKTDKELRDLLEAEQVETRDGTVVLKRTVRSWAERQEASQAAWAGPGVHSVQNDLVVEVS